MVGSAFLPQVIHQVNNQNVYSAGLPANQGIQGKSGDFAFHQGEMGDFLGNQGTFKLLIVFLQSGDFLHTQPCIWLSIIMPKFYPNHSVLCSHFEAQFCFVMRPKS